MIPGRHPMMGRKIYGDAVYVGGIDGNGFSAYAWPGGTREGDVAIVAKKGAAPAGSWTSVTGTGSYGINIYTRPLVDADLTGGFVAGSSFSAGVYREPFHLTYKAVAGQQGPPGSAAGNMAFAKSPLCAGRFAIAAGPAGYGLPVVSTPFSARNVGSDGSHQWGLFDHLDSAAFVSGTGVTVTWEVSDPSGAAYAMYEFTN